MPEAIPTRVTGTEPVSEFEDGSACEANADPEEAERSATFQYGDVLLPEQQHRQRSEER